MELPPHTPRYLTEYKFFQARSQKNNFDKFLIFPSIYT